MFPDGDLVIGSRNSNNHQPGAPGFDQQVRDARLHIKRSAPLIINVDPGELSTDQISCTNG